MGKIPALLRGRQMGNRLISMMKISMRTSSRLGGQTIDYAPSSTSSAGEIPAPFDRWQLGRLDRLTSVF
jgi:hypothetical protein